ncbi:lysophospholipid acyltransferase family protein [Kocuria sp.]|uniref:lysophospholipid acyltransferase family protein n=1 Tax=Kocuria sp. TaxID=1871328 RepID=UPI0026E07338|nr:lysophospholipid acyltransferase family protein [Kocuria sp.]MDO5619557.1 lysophospholipid acyltransferase family protein [Kocuria sp.]
MAEQNNPGNDDALDTPADTAPTPASPQEQDTSAEDREKQKNPPTDRLKIITQWRPWEPSEAPETPPVLESIDAHGAPPEDHGPTPVAPPAESAQIGLEHFTDPGRRRMRAIARKIFFNGLVDRTIRRRVERKPGAEVLSGACVVVANHSSHLDAPLIMSSLPVNLRQNVATGVAADYFFTTWYKKLFTQLVFNAFPIDRKGAGENRGLSRKLLNAGIPVLVFPEGTRSKDGRMRQFKVGAAALASSIKVPVLPVALIGAHEAMPRDTSWPRRGRPPVVVALGEPLYVRENESTVAFNERIQATVRSLYREYRPLIDQ